MNFKPNTQQQECIDNINGKYLVLAGPEQVKLFTIIERIKSMLERNIAPDKISFVLHLQKLLQMK